MMARARLAPLADAVGAQLGNCPACQAVIIWAHTSTGRRLAVDLDPLSPGSPGDWGCGFFVVELFTEYFATGELVDGVQRVRTRPKDRPPESPAWVLHWASCAKQRRALAE